MPVRSGLLGLGSNVGDRRARLQAAVDALPGAGVSVVKASSVYDTDPVGEVLDQPTFLNACLRVETELEPLELLEAVKRAERELGREQGGVRHGPRAIDIDVLLLGDIRFSHERMTLPHEQLLTRRFVLIPALELDFELAAPDGRRLSDALAALPLEGGVRWAGPPLRAGRARPGDYNRAGSHVMGKHAVIAPPEAGYRAGREQSLRLWERACEVFPGGVSGAAKLYEPYPLFIRSAHGSHAVDVDGNEYVDLLMGAGPMLLGHGHPAVLEAIRRQLELMTNPMLPTELSLRLAERIRGHMPYIERLRFVNTGSEATRSALRVARSATGRPLIAKCEGAFHGSDDVFLVSSHARGAAGSDRRPRAVADYAGLTPDIDRHVLVLPFNDPRAAVALISEHAPELAAVIVEPVAFSSGGAVPATRDFAAALRAVTLEHGILLIFDEVLCAYRMGLAGAPAYLGVTPDLAALGKAIGGGLALAAFGGRAEPMEAALGRRAGERQTFQSGTFTENPLSMAAGLAVLDVLEREPVLERADAAGRLLREGLAAELAAHGVEAVVTGVASIAQVHLGAERVENRRDVLRADVEATRRFLLGMVAGGVLWPPIHPAVTSGAHTAGDIERVIATARTVLDGETG